jgi:4-amino-4-deoxy-L-arabinose transferase-like glycosyltransferase
VAEPFDSGRTKGFLARNWALVLIILAALGIRSILLVSLGPWDNDVVERRVLIDDARSYHFLATSIVETGTFEKFDSGFYLRTPGYPLFIAGVYLFAGRNPWVVLLLQIIIDSLTVLIIYWIARELGMRKRSRLIACALYAVSLVPAVCAVRLLSETLFTFLLMLTFLWFIRGLKREGTHWFIYCGLALGAATLVRPLALSLVFIFIGALIFSRLRIRTKALGTTALFFAFFVVILPWQVRNNSHFGRYALSNLAGTNLCRCNVALTKAYDEEISLADARAALEGTALAGVTDPFERSDIYCDIAVGYIKKNTVVFAKYHVKGCVQTFVTTARGGLLDITGRPAASRNDMPLSAGFLPRTLERLEHSKDEYFIAPVLATGQVIVYAMAILGLYLMLRAKQRLYAVLFILTIAYFTLTPGVFSLCRFRIPVIPLLMITAAYGISFSIDRVRSRNR